ncbi:MAG: hypothetical protein ACK521_04330 [bacterium]|jgi:hypothetical protein
MRFTAGNTNLMSLNASIPTTWKQQLEKENDELDHSDHQNLEISKQSTLQKECAVDTPNVFQTKMPSFGTKSRELK